MAATIHNRVGPTDMISTSLSDSARPSHCQASRAVTPEDGAVTLSRKTTSFLEIRPTFSHSVWATLDYVTLKSPDVGGEATWTVERAGAEHGLRSGLIQR